MKETFHWEMFNSLILSLIIKEIMVILYVVHNYYSTTMSFYQMRS